MLTQSLPWDWLEPKEEDAVLCILEAISTQKRESYYMAIDPSMI
jgi:hypothetical protein